MEQEGAENEGTKTVSIRKLGPAFPVGLCRRVDPGAGFLLFFAFAVDFGHWFRKNDEMVEDYMNRSAALAFYVGMAATGILGTGACFSRGWMGIGRC